jgi:hypothetical protein
MSHDALLGFYRGQGTDDRGRRIEDVWRFTNDELEAEHDYIQWLFPLPERSAFNPGAPVLDAATIDAFQRDERLRSNLEHSLGVMLAFYGLVPRDDGVARGPTFAERSRIWLTPHNHNFLRLTRIMKSLTLLGLGERAMQLLECLEQIYRERPTVIGQKTLGYWETSVSA